MSLIFLMIPPSVYASTCAYSETSLTTSQFFLLSETVFMGKVSAIDNYTNHEWKVKFNVEKIWKGLSRPEITVISNSLVGCGYSIVTGEKYLVYANGFPLHADGVWIKPFAEAQNDIKLLDDPKFLAKSKIKEELNKKLEVAKDILSAMMDSKTSKFPIYSLGVDDLNSVLYVGIDDRKASFPAEEYEKRLKEIVGDIPIKVELGHVTPLVPENTEWKTHPSVGKFLYSEPPKPDQIFKVQYRIINGTIDSIKENQGAFGFKINAINDNGLFEIKIPLNFPHTNDLNKTDGKNYAVLINDRYIDEYLNGPNIHDDCFFGFSIPFSKSVSIEVAPSTIPENFPYHGSEVPQRCIKETILFIPPLQQLKSGISANDIVCKEGFELIFKSTNDSPACVKPETKTKLIERGWTKDGKEQFVKISLGEFKNVHSVGSPINDFIIKLEGYFPTYNSPDIKLEDEAGNIVWTNYDDIGHVYTSRVSSVEFCKEYRFYDIGDPLIINKTGTYKFIFSFEGFSVEKEIKIRENVSDVNINSPAFHCP